MPDKKETAIEQTFEGTNPAAEEDTPTALGNVGWETSNPMPTPMEHMFGLPSEKKDFGAWGGIDDVEDGYGADDDDGKKPVVAATKKGKDKPSDALGSVEVVCSLAQLQAGVPPGVDPKKKELALGDAEFESTFGMDKAAFKKLPMWHQKKLKKKKKIA